MKRREGERVENYTPVGLLITVSLRPMRNAPPRPGNGADAEHCRHEGPQARQGADSGTMEEIVGEVQRRPHRRQGRNR